MKKSPTVTRRGILAALVGAAGALHLGDAAAAPPVEPPPARKPTRRDLIEILDGLMEASAGAGCTTGWTIAERADDVREGQALIRRAERLFAAAPKLATPEALEEVQDYRRLFAEHAAEIRAELFAAQSALTLAEAA